MYLRIADENDTTTARGWTNSKRGIVFVVVAVVDSTRRARETPNIRVFHFRAFYVVLLIFNYIVLNFVRIVIWNNKFYIFQLSLCYFVLRFVSLFLAVSLESIRSWCFFDSRPFISFLCRLLIPDTSFAIQTERSVSLEDVIHLCFFFISWTFGLLSWWFSVICSAFFYEHAMRMDFDACKLLWF